jgi:hypothetical protein
MKMFYIFSRKIWSEETIREKQTEGHIGNALTCILKIQIGRGLDSSGSWQVARSCEHGNSTFGFRKRWEISRPAEPLSASEDGLCSPRNYLVSQCDTVRNLDSTIRQIRRIIFKTRNCSARIPLLKAQRIFCSWTVYDDNLLNFKTFYSLHMTQRRKPYLYLCIHIWIIHS